MRSIQFFTIREYMAVVSIWVRVGGDISSLQTLGLSEDYKAKGTPISEWLLLFFGLSLLSPDDVITAFTQEIMPTDDRCQRFADYVVDAYMDERCDFPVSIWA
jgi:hypothetical protein